MDRRVLVALLGQILGYGALLAVYPHGELTPLVEPLQRAPVLLLLPVALFGVPAVVLAIVIGVPLGIVGASPEMLPAVLFARGDVVVFLSAYGLGLVGAWAYGRVRA